MPAERRCVRCRMPWPAALYQVPGKRHLANACAYCRGEFDELRLQWLRAAVAKRQAMAARALVLPELPDQPEEVTPWA